MANWFYVGGSLCFLVGTILNMIGSPSTGIKASDLQPWKVMTPEEALRNHIPLSQNN